MMPAGIQIQVVSLPYNAPMSHIEIVLPFGLPPEKLAPDLLRQLPAPSLAALVSRTRKTSRQPDFDPQARALPHEAWLAFQFGLTEKIEQENSPPFAGAAMHLRGMAHGQRTWFILHPAHVDVGHGEMIMADRRMLDLPDAESVALFDAARPCFEEAGHTLLYGDALNWFVRADAWKDLRTASPDMACGRNLSHWMPEGPNESQWRKLLNEVQMIWHTHPVNAEREQRAAMRVNALWLWGGAPGAMQNFPAIIPYTAAYRFGGRMEAYGQFFPENRPNCSAADVLSGTPEHGLVLLDDLIAPALANDWHAWLAACETLEGEWFAPLLDALLHQRIDRITMVISNDTALKTYVTDRGAQRKFWVRKTLTTLQQ